VVESDLGGSPPPISLRPSHTLKCIPYTRASDTSRPSSWVSVCLCLCLCVCVPGAYKVMCTWEERRPVSVFGRCLCVGVSVYVCVSVDMTCLSQSPRYRPEKKWWHTPSSKENLLEKKKK
jgi:hypothetical protein